MKYKILRANHVSYMTKSYEKQSCESLNWKLLITKIKEKFEIYKNEKDFLVQLYKKERKWYYNTLDVNKSNKGLWWPTGAAVKFKNKK